jgi:hypothetical protein
MPLVRELLSFMAANKRYWLGAFVFQTVLFGILMALSQDVAVAPPFIYTLL